MRKILEDVNLSNISISKDGKEILFQFNRLQNDAARVEVVCSSVYVFNFHNVFEDEYDGLPCYVGEVRYGRICGSDLCRKLKELNFGFRVEEDPVEPNSKKRMYIPGDRKAYFLHMEGGEVDIDIICGEVTINSDFWGEKEF